MTFALEEEGRRRRWCHASQIAYLPEHNEDHYFLNTNVLDIKDLLALV
jgi:hypothetical protein